MSDGYIRLIPASKAWQPTREAASAVAAYVAQLFSGPSDDVERVDYEFYDRVTLIDSGEYTTRITCPRCHRDIGLEWLSDLIEHNGESFDDLDFPVPCCGAVVPLDTLCYDEPVGFARFEVCAMNPTRAEYELDDAELAEVATLLGHPVRQILTHY